MIFDDLFNEFLKGNSKKGNKQIPKIGDELSRIMESIKQKMTSSFDLNLLTDDLGEPNEINTYTMDDRFYTEQIWDTPTGRVIKVFIRDEHQQEEKETIEALELKLVKAVDLEDYDEAIRLRDKIEKLKENKK